MRNMKHFLKTLRSAWYDPDFYEGMEQNTIGPAIGFFFVLGLLGMLLTSVVLAPHVIRFAYSDAPQLISNAYPDDLEITFANNRLSVNQPLPYYVPNTLFATDTVKHLAVFDMENVLPVSLEETSTLMLFKDTYMLLPGQNNSQQVTLYTELGTTTGTLRKEMVNSFVEKIRPYFTYGVLGVAVFIAVAAISFGSLVWTMFHMVYAVIPASVVWLLYTLQKKHAPFSRAYMTTLYATVPVAILTFVSSLLLSVRLPFLGYTALVVLIAIVNTWQYVTRNEDSATV
jgi:hypothetical protein